MLLALIPAKLQRCAAVGRWLRRWGWQHTIAPELAEMDFGAWDGNAWSSIPQADVDAWCADFLHHAPGQGECLQRFFDRVAGWPAPPGPAIAVGHGGWMLARRWLASGAPRPTRANQWPTPPGHGHLWMITP